jgi:hypothetical protein
LAPLLVIQPTLPGALANPKVNDVLNPLGTGGKVAAAWADPDDRTAPIAAFKIKPANKINSAKAASFLGTTNSP